MRGSRRREGWLRPKAAAPRTVAVSGLDARQGRTPKIWMMMPAIPGARLPPPVTWMAASWSGVKPAPVMVARNS